MKKWFHVLFGLVLGIALTISVTAAAEEIKGMVGKKVDDQTVVVLDGKELQVPVIIIEGSSYGPIRAIGEAVNRKVDWKEGKVFLDTKKDVQADPVYNRDRIEAEIQRLEIILHDQKGTFEQYPNWPNKAELEEKISENEAELKVWQDRLSALEKTE